ncbi:hypothetical protein P0082_00060 [Candidatus Haliotispira prima]|uniref:Uncharacterized protein n=1 Tax=Candidatus Haliotispira prima TaxID=3034016 RepID=A0ABY8MIU1_9SPIO|nr:hypothetical protein P0082_00060 [Candidatus Haliotispira prima]
MPLPIETECIVRNNDVNNGPAADPEKFPVYTWEGHSRQSGGNWKISVPLTVVSRTLPELPIGRPAGRKRKKPPPRITLGKPVPPEPPIIMGGGVPIQGLTAGSRVDTETKKRSDEYKLLRSQPLPTQERHEYTAYPEDVQPGQNLRRKHPSDSAEIRDELIYHSYLSLSWQYLGLQDHILDCINNLESICIAHHLPEEMLEQSLYSNTKNPQKRRRSMRFSSALRHRMEAFVSHGKIAFLIGNLRAVAMQIEVITGEALSENEIHELENFQASEELAALDRGLPVLYLYPFNNIYEMERAEEHSGGPNRHHKGISYAQPLRELRCLLQPKPLQQKLEGYADPSLYL